MSIRDSKQFRIGRIGEILQFYWYRSLDVQLLDLADRTANRAPLLHGPNATIISPDTLGRKTADFFLEFKTKTQHFEWNGGSISDDPRVAARTEEGIDHRAWRSYADAERQWKRPLVLSFLAIQQGTIIAATLGQLGVPRLSPHEHFRLVNWDVRSFAVIGTFDADRLAKLFYDPEPKFEAKRKQWIERMPPFEEVKRWFDWMRAQQSELELIRQHVFDHVERGWHAA